MDFIEEQGVFIIANGSFNPAIFHPSWLLLEGVIRREEEEAASIELVHPEISRFNLPGIKFDVQTERFGLYASAEPFVRIADIFQVLFGEKLKHTPISSVGLNFWAHVRLTDWGQRQRFGRALAPLDPWGDFGRLLENRDKALAGGFSTLTMRAALPDNGESGSMSVTVQPSVRVAGDVGVFFTVNTHFGEDSERSVGFATLLHQRFDEVLLKSREIVTYMTTFARSL